MTIRQPAMSLTYRAAFTTVIGTTRAITKIHSGDRGWRYAAALLAAFGAARLDDPKSGAHAWLEEWLPRPLRHRGNHKYAWALSSAAAAHLPDSLAYPKQIDPLD